MPDISAMKSHLCPLLYIINPSMLKKQLKSRSSLITTKKL